MCPFSSASALSPFPCARGRNGASVASLAHAVAGDLGRETHARGGCPRCAPCGPPSRTRACGPCSSTPRSAPAAARQRRQRRTLASTAASNAARCSAPFSSGPPGRSCVRRAARRASARAPCGPWLWQRAAHTRRAQPRRGETPQRLPSAAACCCHTSNVICSVQAAAACARSGEGGVAGVWPGVADEKRLLAAQVLQGSPAQGVLRMRRHGMVRVHVCVACQISSAVFMVPLLSAPCSPAAVLAGAKAGGSRCSLQLRTHLGVLDGLAHGQVEQNLLAATRDGVRAHLAIQPLHLRAHAMPGEGRQRRRRRARRMRAADAPSRPGRRARSLRRQRFAPPRARSTQRPWWSAPSAAPTARPAAAAG